MHASRVSTANRLRRRPGTPTVLATALTLGLLATATAGAQEWQKLPDMPVEKWEPGTVVLDGKLYLFGGYTDGVRSSRLATSSIRRTEPGHGSRISRARSPT